MSNELKSKAIKESEKFLGRLKNVVLNKMHPSHCFETKDKNELKSFLNKIENHHEKHHFDCLFSQHYVHFIELRDHYFVMTVNLPYEFESWEHLQETTDVYFCVYEKHDLRKRNSKSLELFETNDFVEDIAFVFDFFNRNNVFNATFHSPIQLRQELLISILTSEEHYRKDLIDNLKENEDLKELIDLKNRFIVERQSQNKKKKDNKTKNKGLNKSKIKQNESEIQKLKGMIRNLENENKQLKNVASVITSNEANNLSNLKIDVEKKSRDFYFNHIQPNKKSPLIKVYNSLITEGIV